VASTDPSQNEERCASRGVGEEFEEHLGIAANTTRHRFPFTAFYDVLEGRDLEVLLDIYGK